LSRARRVVGDAIAEVSPAVPAVLGPYAQRGYW
jgi:hypothetical protein